MECCDMKQYHRLVRDQIPEIIKADGKICICETLSDKDYIYLLDQKLNEELAEYQEANPWKNWPTFWKSCRRS